MLLEIKNKIKETINKFLYYIGYYTKYKVKARPFGYGSFYIYTIYARDEYDVGRKLHENYIRGEFDILEKFKIRIKKIESDF